MSNFNNNYYSILGIPTTSSIEEIKAIFRKLAKIHHPDKNPLNTGEEFTRILEAYEVLSDPESKKKYDLKLTTLTTAEQKKSASKYRTDRFSEEELKRRQYYQQHYKTQAAKSKSSSNQKKSNYNESRIILFSIPLAVALLFLIINIYSNGDEVKNETSNVVRKIESAPLSSQEPTQPAEPKAIEFQITNQSEPYVEWFGINKFDSLPGENLVVKNQYKDDVVFCLVETKTQKVTCHFLLKSGSNISIDRMLKGNYTLRGYTGENFNPSKKIKGEKLSGGFEKREHYFALDKAITITKNESQTVEIDIDINSIRTGKISQDQFFSEKKS